MPDDELGELIATTRQACKGLIRQARATLQLTTELEERLASRDTPHPQPEEAQGNGQTTHSTRFAVGV